MKKEPAPEEGPAGGAGITPEAPSGDSPPDSAQAARTEFAVAAATFIWFAGTYFVTPFLPLYVQKLGDFSLQETALWTGVSLALTPLVAGALAPAWGMLADRYGRKLLIQRSLLGFTLCLGLMGIAQTPLQLVIIRIFMGVFGGFSAAAAALVSTAGRPSQVTRSIGRVQAARVLGMALGPLPGGLLADAYGYRIPCFVSIIGGVIAFILVTMMAREERGKPSNKRAGWIPFRLIMTGAFLGLFLSVFASRMAERAFDPLVPLLIAQVGPSILGIASTTAIIISVGLLVSAAASTLTGRFVSFDRRNEWLVAVLIIGAIPIGLLFLATNWWEILILRALIGIALGASLTLAFSSAAQITPMQSRAFVLGSLGTGLSFGSSLGYFLSGTLALVSLQTVFLGIAPLFLLAALFAFAFRRDVKL